MTTAWLSATPDPDQRDDLAFFIEFDLPRHIAAIERRMGSLLGVSFSAPVGVDLGNGHAWLLSGLGVTQAHPVLLPWRTALFGGSEQIEKELAQGWVQHLGFDWGTAFAAWIEWQGTA